MDRPATVTPRPALLAEPVALEQAIFTSVHSPVGSGYRIVAASPGLTADEKREIVQRAPTHGNLCDASATGVGFASFELRSYRCAVFVAQHMGLEQTARGGHRVLTLALVLDRIAFRHFDCHPVVFEDILRRHVELQLPKGSCTSLPVLQLMPPLPRALPSALRAVRLPPFDTRERYLNILAAILEGRRLVVTNAPDPREILRWVTEAAPGAAREKLSASWGLKYSPARRFQLVFTNASAGERERLEQDTEFETFDWNARPAVVTCSPFQVWLDFVRQMWREGRQSELDALAAPLIREAAPHVLAQIVRLTLDTERAAAANGTELDELAARHADDWPATKGLAGLQRQFERVIAERRAGLRPPPPPPHR